MKYVNALFVLAPVAIIGRFYRHVAHAPVHPGAGLLLPARIMV
jgi:hypothetical protein